jgi:hypothetical protein
VRAKGDHVADFGYAGRQITHAATGSGVSRKAINISALTVRIA